MKNLFEDINKYLDFDKYGAVFFIAIRVLFLLICGGLTSNWIAGNLELKYILFDLFLILVVLGIEVYSFMKTIKFPVKILDHLTAVADLKSLKATYYRKEKIDVYIDESIQALNDTTCPVTVWGASNDLCSSSFEHGVADVFRPLIRNVSVILDVENEAFTVGVYIKNIYRENESDSGAFLDKESLPIVFRDDLIFEEHVRNFDEINNLEKNALTVTTELMRREKEPAYSASSLSINNQEYTMVSSPIPNVCNSCPNDGIIFIIGEGTFTPPSDVGNTLLIFSRIMSNWCSKYNDCVQRNFYEKNEQSY